MSRAWTFVSIGIILLLTIYLQRLSMTMFGPGSGLYEMVAAQNGPIMDGQAWADRMYVAVSVWFIWIIRVGVIAAGLYREFTKQNVTAARVRGGPP